MAIVITMSGAISVADNSTTNPSPYQKSLTGLNFTGSSVEIYQTLSFGTSPTSVTLPISPAQYVYIKNLSATGGNTLSIAWTIEGGSSEPVIVLQGGGFVIFGETVVSASTGITALAITASGASTPAELIIAG